MKLYLITVEDGDEDLIIVEKNGMFVLAGKGKVDALEVAPVQADNDNKPGKPNQRPRRSNDNDTGRPSYCT